MRILGEKGTKKFFELWGKDRVNFNDMVKEWVDANNEVGEDYEWHPVETFLTIIAIFLLGGYLLFPNI